MKIPETDSISELAAFWDTHDVTEFSDELVEASEPVFALRPMKPVTVPLSPNEVKALRDIASSQGVDQAVLLRKWVQEKLPH